jgi:hypothetical protein
VVHNEAFPAPQLTSPPRRLSRTPTRLSSDAMTLLA